MPVGSSGLYAGRASLLREFVVKLRQDRCPKPLIVITGSDGSTLPDTLEASRPGEREVSVIYAALASRLALADQRFEKDFVEAGFRDEDLNNGWAIMGHDAMRAAVSAIDNAAGRVDSAKVWHELANLNSVDQRVNGAVGSFEIDRKNGNAVGRKIPIMELGPHERWARIVDRYEQPNPRCGGAHEC